MALTLQQRRKQLVLTGAAGVAMAGVIALLVNVLANWVFLRLDMTQQRVYSLSPSSKKLVRGLEDPLLVKAFFTPDLPAPYNAFQRYARDLLTEYRSASGGKVRFEFVLAHPPQAFEEKAAEVGLMPIQFEQLGSDQVQIRRGYMGLVLYHRDKSETVPIIKDIQQLEFDVTSRIARMAVRTKKVIGLTSGHGETAWRNPQVRLSTDLGEMYDFKDVALPLATTAPIEADALLVVGPKQKLDEASLWALDQAIMRGIPVAFLIDIRSLMINQFYVTGLDAGLGELLTHYGAQVGDRLVYDAKCETIGVTQNMSGFAFTTSMRYPFIPLATDLAKDHPVLRGIDAVGLPFTTTIEPATNPPSGVAFTTLLRSSPRSWLAPAQPHASVAPNHVPRPGKDDPHGPYSLGGVLEGRFTSYFQGKPPPVPGQALIATSPKTALAVLGTSHVLDPQMPVFPGGEALVSNLVAYLSKDDTLLGIRSKGDIIRPLKPISGPSRDLVKYGSVLGAALLPVALGLWRWRARQAWRRTLAAAFAPPSASAPPVAGNP